MLRQGKPSAKTRFRPPAASGGRSLQSGQSSGTENASFTKAPSLLNRRDIRKPRRGESQPVGGHLEPVPNEFRVHVFASVTGGNPWKSRESTTIPSRSPRLPNWSNWLEPTGARASPESFGPTATLRRGRASFPRLEFSKWPNVSAGVFLRAVLRLAETGCCGRHRHTVPLPRC